ncbi:MAG TPA: hypothetical protein VJL35_01810 [Gemmatimonadaceae bacterium]|jgi:hypothetical protein|nr:hypothetical protein [Gemmatimonadaceae bacterium]
MIETTERFLKEIGDKVGVGYVESIHLFPPIRQGGVETGAAVVAASLPEQERHTVYSASYRHTIKGPERGKWESEVTAEADAPLMTVELVVQGVMKRAGEPFQPEKLTAAEFRTIIGATDLQNI